MLKKIKKDIDIYIICKISTRYHINFIKNNKY